MSSAEATPELTAILAPPYLPDLELVWDCGHLAIPITPLPGEGLAELVVRATAENSYGSCETIPGAIGLEGNFPAGFSGRLQGREAALASLLGVPGGAASLEPLMFMPDADQKGLQSFFGTSIRQVYRDAKKRRVSPRALARSPHLRAIWSIRIFGFDPSTKEMLLDCCPVCGKAFGWARTRGVVFCENCTYVDSRGCERGAVDLRDHPQPLVEEEYWQNLDFLTGLIDPDPDVRASFAPSLPEALRTFERGELFEFAIALACAFETSTASSWGYLARHARKDRYKRLTPGLLATAAAAVLDWPRTFNLAVEEARSGGPARPGHYGVRKEIGSIAALRIDHFINTDLKAVLCCELERHLCAPRTLRLEPASQEADQQSDHVPMSAARESLGISKNRMARLVRSGRVSSIRTAESTKAAVLVSVQEIADVIAADAELRSWEQTAARLGVPCLAIPSLCERGLLEVGRDRRGNDLPDVIDRSSLETLIQSVNGRLIAGDPPAGAAPLNYAATCLGSPQANPWPDILQAISQGTVRAWRTKHTGPITGVLIDLEEAQACIADPLPWPQNAVVSHVDAARLLGTNCATLHVLFAAKKLPQRPTIRDLDSFAGSYVLTSEIVHQLARNGLNMHPRNVARLVQEFGVRPATPPGRLNRLCWPRAEAEAAIASILQLRSESPAVATPVLAFPRLLRSPSVSPMVSAARAADAMCVPQVALCSLSVHELIRVREAIGYSEMSVELASVSDLLEKMEQRLLLHDDQSISVPMGLAGVLAGSPHVNPWPGMIGGILDGSIRANRSTSAGRCTVTVPLLSVGEVRTQSWSDREAEAELPQSDIGYLLGTTARNASGLVRDELLPRTSTLTDVRKFASLYAFTSEISALIEYRDGLRNPIMTAALLRARGIKPALQLPYKHALIWNREEVRYLGSGF